MDAENTDKEFMGDVEGNRRADKRIDLTPTAKKAVIMLIKNLSRRDLIDVYMEAKKILS